LKICASGVVSLILEKDFFVSSYPLIKVPFYGIMGIAISFSITFTICDMINYFSQKFVPKLSKSIVETHT